MNGARTHNLVVIATDCISSNKSSYHTITTTTAPCCLKTIHYSYDKKNEKLMVFMVDQNKWVVFLLELNIEYKIVIQYDMKLKYS